MSKWRVERGYTPVKSELKQKKSINQIKQNKTMNTTQFTAVYSNFMSNTVENASRRKYVKRLKENNAELETLKAAYDFSCEICCTSPDYEIIVANSKIRNFLFFQLDIIP